MRKEIHFMGGIKLFCVLAVGIFLLPACGKIEEKDKNGLLAPMESDEVGSDFEYQFVTESKDGYYFWERVSPERPNPRLMFMDKESGRVVPLCNRPDCTHESIECNAYFREHHEEGGGVRKQYLQYYEGNLYAVGLSEDAYVSLFRIRADGSAEWEISAKLYRTDYAVTNRWESPEILIDAGDVYFVDWHQKIKKLERMPIDGGTLEVLFEGDSDASTVDICRIKSHDGFLFFQVMSYPDDIPENIVGGLYYCNLTTRQCSLVKEGLFGPYSVHNGLVYYGNTMGLCQYSIQDQTTEILVDQPVNVPNITLTRDYIILCDQMADCGLTLYDYDGIKLTTVPNTLGLAWYFGGDSDKLFGECWNDYISMCFLDLTRPVTELQWEELKEN